MTYKLRKLQYILIFLLLICMTTVSLSLNVNAGTETLVEGMYSDESNISGSTSSSGYWYSTYCKGGGYLGQGVLVYLLYRNGGGAVEGTSPKAFACNSTVKAYTLNAQDKYERYAPVTQWESTAPYWADTVSNNGAIINSSATSNTAKIKSWLTTPSASGNSTKGINMVQDLWGASVAEKFTNEEIFLVIEPIIANQFTQSGTNPMQSKIDSLPDSTSMETLVRILRQTENATATIYPQTALSSDLQNLLTTAETNLANQNKMPTTVSEPIRKNLLNNMRKANWKIYKTLGEPYASTPKGLISYFNSLTADSGYTKAESGKYYYRKYANCYAYVDQTSVICKNANFQLWNSSSTVNVLHTDSDINTKSIGMICMLAWSNGGQTTCDEPSIPSEHKAPDESTGTYTIVKNYRI